LITPLILRPTRPRSFSKSVEALGRRLPQLEGRPVRIRFLPALTAGSRKLYSKRAFGEPVYAASYIRKRVVVLDQELQRSSAEFARILTHELFHFAWVRLGNPARRAFESLLLEEWKQRARGELGWSAESRKSRIFRASPRPSRNLGGWRDYACESFCDTAAWLYSGVRNHPEFTLAQRHRNRRARWFEVTFQGAGIPI
jgi:hypothetical protein